MLTHTGNKSYYKGAGYEKTVIDFGHRFDRIFGAQAQRSASEQNYRISTCASVGKMGAMAHAAKVLGQPTGRGLFTNGVYGALNEWSIINGESAVDGHSAYMQGATKCLDYLDEYLARERQGIVMSVDQIR